MIRKLTESDFAEAVTVICKSFMTVAEEFNITKDNAPHLQHLRLMRPNWEHGCLIRNALCTDTLITEKWSATIT